MVALYPSVPEPTDDPKALRAGMLALKEGYELLIGVRAQGAQAALTPTTINGTAVILSLQNTATNSAAAIVTEATLRATADSAEATLRTAIGATVNDPTTGVVATAGIVSTLSSTVNNGSTGVVASASAITALQATVTNNQSTNSAAITNEQSVRAAADSANASSITSVSTTVAGHTGSITALLTSVNGLVVKYAVQLVLNGVTGGYTVTGIQRADGTGPVFTMEINSNVIINGNLLINGTVTSRNMGTNSITVPYYQTLSATVPGNSAYQLVLGYTVFVDTTGLNTQALTLSAIFNAGQGFPSGSGTWFAQLSFNGGAGQTIGGPATDVSFALSDTYQFTGTGGTVAITVYAYWWGQTGSVNLANRTLVTTVFKR